MPSRASPIVTDQMYHVFNRSVGEIQIFQTVHDYDRIYNLIDYYRYSETPVRYSFYRQSHLKIRESLYESLQKSTKLVSIVAFALMPNHLHLILKQQVQDGISTFMRRVENGYAKYFNTKYKRHGAIFQSQFKGVRIESDVQLIHVVRYTHINPFTSYVLKSIDQLDDYPWTSFRNYVHTSSPGFIDAKEILSHFASIDEFIQFTKEQAYYQRELKKMHI